MLFVLNKLFIKKQEIKLLFFFLLIKNIEFDLFTSIHH